MTRHVLMVDDEVDVVWSMERQFRRERPDISFQGSNDPEDALARIRERVPDLLVTDVRMPRMSGLELIVAARAVAPALPVVVITAYGSAEVRREVRNFSSVDYLDKPFTFKELLARIDRSLGSEEGFSGSVSVSFPDIIQLYALSMASGALHVTRGGEEATLWFDGGDLVHATLGPLRGEAAVFRLLAWKGGAFQLTAGSRAEERSITASWQEILIEGCRQLDEAQGNPGGRDEGSDAAAAEWRSLVSEAGNASLDGDVLGIPRESGAAPVSVSLEQGPDAREAEAPAAAPATPFRILVEAWAATWIEALGSGVALAYLRSGERAAYDFLVRTRLVDANGGPRFRRSLTALAKACSAGHEPVAAVPRLHEPQGALPLDANAETIVPSIAGARSCSILDDAGRSIGTFSAGRSASAPPDSAISAIGRLFEEGAAGGSPSGRLEEIRIGAPSWNHFARRLAGRSFVVVSTVPAENAGLVWAELKTAAPGILRDGAGLLSPTKSIAGAAEIRA